MEFKGLIANVGRNYRTGKVSEATGFTVWLCAAHHNMSNAGVHFDRALDLHLKQEQQREYEKTHSREDFMRLIGKNYLED